MGGLGVIGLFAVITVGMAADLGWRQTLRNWGIALEVIAVNLLAGVAR